jgi:hypothetical protein
MGWKSFWYIKNEYSLMIQCGQFQLVYLSLDL